MSSADWGRQEIKLSEAEKRGLIVLPVQLETHGSGQADYIDLKVKGPFKPEHNRY